MIKQVGLYKTDGRALVPFLKEKRMLPSFNLVDNVGMLHYVLMYHSIFLREAENL